ncbi:UDP-glucose--hexose-1-phosphate uridylyltransferase [uncultured Vagococcus sp.]|uniref:UDP-glucose--hexose-1-phosphate uridylyltransferase n=1 Tax=uncultured Vagococcus sp. TaxID=189676 RepID=UPI0028D2A3D6|nr:UDP-glucose--hexose-1-phosphate uridylyltransferase [uncultured Vagococcus sp.]
MSVSQLVEEYTTLAIRSGGWMEMDRLYLRNRLLSLIGESEFLGAERAEPRAGLELLDALVEVGISNQVTGDSLPEREILEAKIGDLLTPPPSVVNALFAERYDKDPVDATDYFFDISRQNNYIKTREIASNIVFPVETEYGELEITINLSKPEKDSKQIALEKSTPSANYPRCMLCMENEGYEGRLNYPARTNHRLIRMNIEGESWGLQYSPYAYYNEHSIFLSEEHRPMVISQDTFKRLLTIVEIFPHYFVGSNADLPIVGGSILSHDHYQGGRHTFAMAKAPIETEIALPLFKEVSGGIVKWPMSVIRLQSNNKQQLIQASYYILEQWKQHSNEGLGIQAFSEDGTPHHTITPIARRVDELYELDLVLRDNNVSSEHPEGIFHPHHDVQHIKKENIGLIEVMGLAVLPPRLKEELLEVERYLLGHENHMAEYHLPWAEELKSRLTISADSIHQQVLQEVGLIFARVLEDAGVFKRDEAGQTGFRQFTDGL